uniref:Uncharacterized protein n=1 Tax=Lepeophtheirus salmonis TaxID=72036 RepID=A0A0K2UU77_LEPSM
MSRQGNKYKQISFLIYKRYGQELFRCRSSILL